MLDVFTSWTRLMAAGTSIAETGLRAFETARAAGEVIAARTPIIETAMRSPLTGDHRELARMVPEKVEAFSRAGSAAVSAWWTAQSAWMDHLQHFHAAALRGGVPTPADLGRLGERNTTALLEAVEATVQLASDTLAPIHTKATSNARRLRGKRKRT
ncbi:hypothetical protein [Sphingobium nicotianae]|uniref:Phasin domain-containing protein n=1 Tax=Sphingobium nicotianae TaxID=2782607 RepID=A0A9X1IQW4_9SPHN|nr:hypothetical protein [Sphingobium nicotianae]MBT2186780.1 hypothetical protein [Sphingobium nicotianae]